MKYNVGVAHRSYSFYSTEYSEWLADANINCYEVDLSKGELDDKLQSLVTGNISVDQLDNYPKLEAVIVPFTGINQLDLDELKRRNIHVFNSTAHARFVAERALTLTLAVMGKVVFFHNCLVKGEWGGRLAGAGGTGIKWNTLYNKRVAIYGYGTIGKELGNLLAPFNTEVGILNYKNRQFEGVDNFDSIDELSKWCDIFIVTAPLNEVTEGIIDKEVLINLKGKVLINVGRGPIINEKDLYNSLISEGLSGFGSDVWYEYPDAEVECIQPSKYSFSSLDQVVMTPHNGGGEIHADRDKYIDVASQLKQISLGDYSSKVR